MLTLSKALGRVCHCRNPRPSTLASKIKPNQTNQPDHKDKEVEGGKKKKKKKEEAKCGMEEERNHIGFGKIGAKETEGQSEITGVELKGGGGVGGEICIVKTKQKQIYSSEKELITQRERRQKKNGMD